MAGLGSMAGLASLGSALPAWSALEIVHKKHDSVVIKNVNSIPCWNATLSCSQRLMTRNKDRMQNMDIDCKTQLL